MSCLAYLFIASFSLHTVQSLFFFLMIRRPPRSTLDRSSAASDVYKRQPPQLARYALRYYSKPGELLLDPMVGSGTALVEACMMGRNALGYDIDPLARLIAQTKSTVLEDEEIGEAQKLVLESAVRDCDTLEVDGRRASLDIRTRAIAPDFINRDYWFDPEILTALSILAHHISSVEMSRDCLLYTSPSPRDRTRSRMPSSA